MRSDANKLLKDYTKRVLANHENRRRRALQPLWADSYDAAAECNIRRDNSFDQSDQILTSFSDVAEMLIKVSTLIINQIILQISKNDFFRALKITKNCI